MAHHQAYICKYLSPHLLRYLNGRQLSMPIGKPQNSGDVSHLIACKKKNLTSNPWDKNWRVEFLDGKSDVGKRKQVEEI
jgi:hypothetical protein